MKCLNTLVLSAVLTLVAIPMAFGCPCKQNASNEAFLKSIGRDPNDKVIVQRIEDVQ